MAMALEFDQRHLVIEKYPGEWTPGRVLLEFVWSLMMLKIYKIVKIASWYTFGTQSFPGGKET